MRLSSIRVVGLGPFDDLTLNVEPDERPRGLLCILGGSGVGKTSLLAAIASTRPGFAPVPPRASGARAGFAVASYWLGDDEPGRPHPLRVASPHAVLAEPEDATALRRREQALFDRRAGEGGFALVALSGARWFSRAPVALGAPERTAFRHDPRAMPSFDDASRSDLARETKQLLSYLCISAALSEATRTVPGTNAQARRDELAQVLDLLGAPFGHRFVGAHPATLEPLFERDDGAVLTFDELPTSARHLIAFGALPARALLAAYPEQGLRAGEAVVLIDDAEAHLGAHVQRALVPALQRAFPRVQWILTTASPDLAAACDARQLVALRRPPGAKGVTLFEGEQAVLH